MHKLYCYNCGLLFRWLFWRSGFASLRLCKASEERKKIKFKCGPKGAGLGGGGCTFNLGAAAVYCALKNNQSSSCHLGARSAPIKLIYGNFVQEVSELSRAAEVRGPCPRPTPGGQAPLMPQLHSQVFHLQIPPAADFSTPSDRTVSAEVH